MAQRSFAELQHTLKVTAERDRLRESNEIMLKALTDLVDWYDMDEGDLRPLMNAARIALSEKGGTS